MGANFNDMTLPGTTTRKDVETAFAEAQDADRYENGHDYSGGFGMARGLKFADRRIVLADGNAACVWLMDNCQKWDEAIAVRFRDKDGTEQWMIGAWCAG